MRWEAEEFSPGVVDIMMQNWAASTRATYDPKWADFKRWCCARQRDPFTCPLPQVFEYLHHLVQKGAMPSTVRVYASSLTAHRGPNMASIIGSPAGHLFFKGLLRLRPPKKPAPPQWDVAEVLRTLCQPPFEPLAEASDRHLSIKTAFLLAVCTGFRVSDLVGLSIQDECLVLQDDLSQVVLRPNPAFIGKSGPTANIHPVTLVAFPPPGEDDRGDLKLLCPVRIIAAYLDRTRPFRGSTCQLFVCYGGKERGQAIKCDTISRWIVEAISAATGTTPGSTATAHSTRGVSSSVALLRGVSFKDICLSARWSSTNTFCRYYLRDVGSGSFAHAVLDTARAGRK